ncbi:hypothetical protein ACFV5N_22490 [Streptomyces sp. NPDC059853]|uniref:hypothetical protein n=1 Tax=Streptomyces sp. NPDC059853 TaxID=3346973 RepID=UPI0036490388
MPASAPRPLLFPDVDGPLIPFGPRPGPFPVYPVGGAHGTGRNPLLARNDPRHGARPAALPCEPVWATTWGEEANTWIAPILGLPPLPVLDEPEPSVTDGQDARAGRLWKTRAVVARAAGRPFAWVDDEITDADRTWVAGHHPAPALPHRVDPGTGLTDEDWTALARRLRDPR